MGAPPPRTQPATVKNHQVSLPPGGIASLALVSNGIAFLVDFSQQSYPMGQSTLGSAQLEWM